MKTTPKSRTKLILNMMHIMVWVLFFGICIKTGSILYSFFVSLFINSVAANNLHMGLDLSGLYEYSTWQYSCLVSLIVFLSALKAFIFYLLIRIFQKINFVNPFSNEVSKLISGISYFALVIALLTFVTNSYCNWLMKRGVIFPDLQSYAGGASEFILLGGVIFMIAQVFKRGIEIQSENELTV